MKNLYLNFKNNPGVIKGVLIKLKNINIISLFLCGILLMDFNDSFGQTYAFTAPQGYGAATTGGGNATPTTVTTYAQLQSALTASGPGVILVSGTIDFSSSGMMEEVVKNKTLIGLPGAKFTNTNQSSSGILYLDNGSTNVIIRNLIFVGPGAWDNNGNDNLTIKSCTNLWVDHCEFQDGEDGNFDNTAVTDNVTVTWCKFTYLKAPRPHGSGTTDDHRFTNLVGGSDSDKPSDGQYSITWQYCWWAEGCVERMTRARNAQLNMLSCYWNSSVASVDLGLGGITDCYVENSVFASSGLSYKNYSNGAVRLTSVGCTNPPANVGTCPAPTYTRESIAAGSVVSALTGPCGAGATLSVTTTGVISPNTACSTTPTLTLTSGTASQSVSAGTAITSIVYTWGGNATDVTISGLPAGLSSVKNAGAKTITITGTPTATGTYTVTTVQSAGTAVALSGTITVVPLVAPTLVLTSGSATQSFLLTTALSNIIYTWGGGATDVTVSGLPAGVTATKNTVAKTVTLSGTPTATGISNFSVVTVGGLTPMVTLTGTITVTTPVVLATPGSITATSTSTTATINWSQVSNATGYVVNWCTVPSGGSPVDVTAALNSTTHTGGYYVLSSGDKMYTAIGTSTSGPCAPATLRTSSANDFVLELAATASASSIRIGGSSSSSGSNRTLLNYSINGGATQTAGINGLFTAQDCTTEITITGLNLNAGDKIAFNFNNQNVQISYFIITTTGAATPVCTQYIVSGGANTTYTVTGLTPSTTYSYQVKATDAASAETSPYSTSTNISTSAGGNVPPVISITAPATGVCATVGSTVTFTANATDADGTISNVKFYNGATLLGTGTASGSNYSYAWTNVVAGTYTITAVATDNGTATTTSTAITVNVPPAVSITGLGTGVITCTTPTITFGSGQTASSYAWTKGGVAAGTGSTLAVTTAGTYGLTVTYANGCTATATTVATTVDNAAPAVSITGLGTGVINCTTTSITLGSNQTASSYAWTKGGVAAGTGSTLAVTTAGTYGLTVTYANGCTATATTVATTVDNAAPAVSITGLGTGVINCTTTSITLGSSQTASSYAWTKGGVAAGTGSTLAVTTAGTYGLTVTYANGCTATATTVATTVNTTAPAVSITGLGAGVINCTTTSITLGSNQTASSYAWTKGGVAAGTGSTLAVTTAGTYGLTVTYANGCTATATTVATTVNTTAPAVSITGLGAGVINCTTTSITLGSNQTASSYAWTKGGVAAGTGSTLAVTTAGTYGLIVTYANGCTATATTVATTVDNAAPAVSITGLGTGVINCTTTSITLGSNQTASSYAWTKGGVAAGTGSTLAVTTAGTYGLIVTYANGCTATATTVATTVDNAAPAVSITGLGTGVINCTTTSITLGSSQTASSYAWTKGGVAAGTGSTLAVTTAGTYGLTVTYANGCTAAATTVATTVNTTASAVSITGLGAGVINCTTPTITLGSSQTASGYAWTKGGVAAGTGSTLAVTTAGTYGLTVTYANGCTAIASTVATTINTTAPAVSINGLGTGVITCAAPTITLSSSQTASSYTWTKGGVAAGTGSTLAVTTAGTYGLTVTYANGCTATATTVATTVDNAAPAVSITGLGAGIITCAIPSITLSSSQTASGYAWTQDGVSAGSASTLAASNAAVYGLTVTYANGCTATAPTVTTTKNATIPTVTLTGAATGAVINCTTPNYTLGYTVSSGTVIGQTWSTTATGTSISVSNASTYNVAVSFSNGCNATSNSVSLTKDIAAPAVSISGLGAGVITCATPTITLSSSQTASSYAWTKGGVAAGTGSTLAVTTAGTYGLTVTYANGCTATATTIATTVNTTAPAVSITGLGAGVINCTTTSITLGSSQAASSYAWTKGGVAAGTGSTLAVTTAGTYGLTITYANGCTAAASNVATTVDNVPPTATITPGGPTTFVTGGNVILNANTGAGLTYQWYNNASPLSGSTGVSYIATTAGNYTVEVTNSSTCKTTSTAVTVIVNANQPSVITVTSPTDNSTVTGTSLTISVTASDPDGGISKVEYYDNGILIGSNLNSPYDFVWNNPGTGSHVITVKVTDTNGGVTTSASVNITVGAVTAIIPSASYGVFTSVYPNPSSESFKVTFVEKVSHISIINCHGEQVGELQQIDAGKQIEIGEELPQGMYMLIVEYASNKREVAKIVKVK